MRRVANLCPSGAPLVAVAVTMTAPDSPGASVNVSAPLKVTPSAAVSSTAAEKVFADPDRLVTVIVALREPPAPLDQLPNDLLTGATPATASTAAATSNRPAPVMSGSSVTSPVSGCRSRPSWAVLTIAERTCSAVQAGWSARTTAAAPARCGVAMLVPPRKPKQGGALHVQAGWALSTSAPGATTSGLISRSPCVGPWLLNPAIRLVAAGSSTYVPRAWSVAGAPSWSSITAPSERRTITPGIVGAGSRPLCDITNGASSVWSTMITQTAPAFCALRIFTVKSQVPRPSRAILPVRSGSGGSVSQAVLSP